MFSLSNLLTLSLLLRLLKLDAIATCKYCDLPEPLHLSSCVPIPGPNLLHPLQDRSNDTSLPVGASPCTSLQGGEGLLYLVNSFGTIEPKAAKVLRKPNHR
ncbi:hypothetical protein Cni_G21425 [Canna indica]|uniref:Secreted protein n=1 Tax=Canna indica TaxID=4628 RepID=A0AAQ3QKA2_9LILI|nr:hypothetical protein Cni_G21425 [Canna indica]